MAAARRGEVYVGKDAEIAEVTLTPHQAKRVIARGVASLPQVRRAWRDGIIALHPSTSTLPVVEELAREVPEGVKALGMIRAKGLCVSLERQEAARSGDRLGRHPSGFTYTWVFARGKLEPRAPEGAPLGAPGTLGAILERMGPGDIYVKGCNALDTSGRAGVLYASPHAGTIGLVAAARAKRRFEMVLPVGLEKLIPGSIDDAARAARTRRITNSLGQRCGLFPVDGTVVTEVSALEMLFGVRATVIAAGGVGGGEGSTVLALEGAAKDVGRAYEYVREVKESVPAKVADTVCDYCPIDRCLMPRRK